MTVCAISLRKFASVLAQIAPSTHIAWGIIRIGRALVDSKRTQKQQKHKKSNAVPRIISIVQSSNTNSHLSCSAGFVRLNERKGSDIINVLVACEESQEVCKAFRARGHRAFSCDIQECSGGHPEWHIQGDCLPLLNGNCTFTTADTHTHTQVGKWDLIIAHPPCTDLAVSGARWFPEKQKDFRQQKACVFFMQMALADCDRIAVENPIGIMSSVYRKPDQIIQPYQFGHPVRKSTCLWLKGLPTLKPTDIVSTEEDEHGFSIGGALRWAVDENGKTISWNDPRTAKARSKTFPGIAAAMAEQWG